VSTLSLDCIIYDSLQTLPDIFDVLLTRSLESLHVLDFNPYLPRTDALHFSYEELLSILQSYLASSEKEHVPKFACVSSRFHPAANRNAPVHQHNMLPVEALQLSSGRDIESFAQVWRDEVARGAEDSDDE
jgi:hypothetical protein